MIKKRSSAGASGPPADQRAAEIDALMTQVGLQLESNNPNNGLELIRQANMSSPWIKNAVGVCQLRLNRVQTSMDIFRSLAVSGGIHIRNDVPAAFRLNLAASLLADENLQGFLHVLGHVQDDEHPSARRYREEYRRWKKNRPLIDKMRDVLGLARPEPFRPNFPLGDLI